MAALSMTYGPLPTGSVLMPSVPRALGLPMRPAAWLR